MVSRWKSTNNFHFPLKSRKGSNQSKGGGGEINKTYLKVYSCEKLNTKNMCVCMYICIYIPRGQLCRVVGAGSLAAGEGCEIEPPTY